MSKKLAAAIAKNSSVDAKYALGFLRNVAEAHAARMHHARGQRRAAVHAHYVSWLSQVRQAKRLAYYGYNAAVHEFIN